MTATRHAQSGTRSTSASSWEHLPTPQSQACPKTTGLMKYFRTGHSRTTMNRRPACSGPSTRTLPSSTRTLDTDDKQAPVGTSPMGALSLCRNGDYYAKCHYWSELPRRVPEHYGARAEYAKENATEQNAHKRNEQFRDECRSTMVRRARRYEETMKNRAELEFMWRLSSLINTCV